MFIAYAPPNTPQAPAERHSNDALVQWARRSACDGCQVFQSQRDCVPKPKVARDELPWDSRLKINNSNGVAASCARPVN